MAINTNDLEDLLREAGLSTDDVSFLGNRIATLYQEQALADQNQENALELTEEQLKEQGKQNRATTATQANYDARNSYFDALNEAGQTQFDRQADLYQSYYDEALGAAGLMNEQQKAAAMGEYDPSLAFYDEWMDTGGISQADEQMALSSAYNDVIAQTQAMQGGVNASMASNGLGNSAMGMAALGMTGNFAAAGERSNARREIQSERRANQMTAADARTGIADSLADLQSSPTFESVYGQIGQVQMPTYASGPTVYAPDYSAPAGTPNAASGGMGLPGAYTDPNAEEDDDEKNKYGVYGIA